MWKAVKAKKEEVRMAEAKCRRGQRESREKTEGAGNEEAKGEKNSRGKKSSEEMGDLEQGGESSKIRRGSEEISLQKVSSVD